ncbi:MAG: hypothetical protein VYE68_09265, partial [Acidobacteriota bacterium]|nr:hypothetical protein [Acidobacteriota bacterium]
FGGGGFGGRRGGLGGGAATLVIVQSAEVLIIERQTERGSRVVTYGWMDEKALTPAPEAT